MNSLFPTGIVKPNSSEPFDLNTLADNWPSPLVARDQKQLDKFSGGILNDRSLANADCLGTGPMRRVKVGRKVAYPVESLIEWMQSKMEGVG
jgi:hypothetical protein